jgi:hypothetical protein
MRQPPRIAEEQLRGCLQEQYGLFPYTLTFLPLGLDAHAGVYHAGCANDVAYLLKIRPGSLYDMIF